MTGNSLTSGIVDGFCETSKTVSLARFVKEISASNFILHTFANGCRISKYEKKYFLGNGKCTHRWRADHETLTCATQEAVDLMLQLKLARTRWEAVLLGRQLVTVK